MTEEQIQNRLSALPEMPLSQIAAFIQTDWKKVYFGAVPYLDAMRQLYSVGDSFWNDSGHEIVNYFLCNAQTWRGPVAVAIKAELKRRLKA